METYTLPYVKWIAGGNLLNDTGNPKLVFCDDLKGWGTYVYLRLVHVDVWWKPSQYCFHPPIKNKTKFLKRIKDYLNSRFPLETLLACSMKQPWWRRPSGKELHASNKWSGSLWEMRAVSSQEPARSQRCQPYHHKEINSAKKLNETENEFFPSQTTIWECSLDDTFIKP